MLFVMFTKATAYFGSMGERSFFRREIKLTYELDG